MANGVVWFKGLDQTFVTLQPAMVRMKWTARIMMTAMFALNQGACFSFRPFTRHPIIRAREIYGGKSVGIWSTSTRRLTATSSGDASSTVSRASWTKLPRLHIGEGPSSYALSATQKPFSRHLQPTEQSANTDKLGKDMLVPLSSDQSHYLATVLRLNKKKSKAAPLVRICNGKEEWIAEIKRETLTGGRPSKSDPLLARCVERVRSSDDDNNKRIDAPSCWMFVAPPKKKDRSRFLVEKCTELGTTGFTFLETEFSESPEKFNKLMTYALEASEQSERLCLPLFVTITKDDVRENGPRDSLHATKLMTLLDAWAEDDGRFPLLVCRERAGTTSPPALEVLQSLCPVDHVGCLIGPEGGWSPVEEESFDRMEAQFPSSFYNVALNQNVLRTETAAAAAATLFGMVSAKD